MSSQKMHNVSIHKHTSMYTSILRYSSKFADMQQIHPKYTQIHINIHKHTHLKSPTSNKYTSSIHRYTSMYMSILRHSSISHTQTLQYIGRHAKAIPGTVCNIYCVCVWVCVRERAHRVPIPVWVYVCVWYTGVSEYAVHTVTTLRFQWAF